MKNLKQQSEATLLAHTALEDKREEMFELDRQKNQEILTQKELYMDEKRELEFEVLMLEEANERVVVREEKRVDDEKHKIDISLLQQEKLQK